MQPTPCAFTSQTSAPVRFGHVADRRSEARASLVSPIVLAGLARAGELILTLGLGLGLAIADAGHHATPWVAAAVAMATAVAVNAVCARMGLFAVPGLRRVKDSSRRMLAVWSLAFLTLSAVFTFPSLRPEISHVWLSTWFLALAASLMVGRLALAATLGVWAEQGRLTQRAVIYGSGPPCQSLLDAIAADPTSNVRICGIYDNRGRDRDGHRADAVSKGSLDDLIRFARTSRVDLILLALPISAETRLLQLLDQLWVLPVDIRLAASASKLRLAPQAYDHAGRVELIALADKPISDWGLLAKSVFDRVIGTLALIALAPLMALTALAIKLDSRGPVLFRQKRYGFNNELIEVYKFRSMRTDMADHAAAKLVTKDDPRVTRVGRFIRKTSIDELPQLINVLIGNLSLVGPRPHAISAKAGTRLYDDVMDSYFARHKVKPGITGWAQINGWRGETDTEDKLRHRVEHDLHYIETWSLALDAEILLRTPLSLIKHENAY